MPDFHQSGIVTTMHDLGTTDRDRLESLLVAVTRNYKIGLVLPVIEGLANTGNVSAVMRSAEAMGFHQFHIIENNSHFKHSERTSKGAEKWLMINRWATPESCADYLHDHQYSLLAWQTSLAGHWLRYQSSLYRK